MDIQDALQPVAPPIRAVGLDCFRVGSTRIPLERVVNAFNGGCTPEEIVRKFPTLILADVYAVIAFYLRNQEAVDDYVRAKELQADEAERLIRHDFPSEPFRAVLLARRAR